MFKRGEQYTLNVDGVKLFNHHLTRRGVIDQKANEGDTVWVLEDDEYPFCALVKYYPEIPELNCDSVWDRRIALGEGFINQLSEGN